MGKGNSLLRNAADTTEGVI